MAKRNQRALASLLLIGLLGSGPASAADQPPAGKAPATAAPAGGDSAATASPMKTKKSAEDRIKEAVVPPPGEPCPPDPEEIARIARLKVDEILQTWISETTVATRAAGLIADAYWEQGRDRLMTRVTEEASPWSGRPSTVAVGVKATDPVPMILSQTQCAAFARLEQTACAWKGDEPVLSQLCPGWLLYRKLGITKPDQCATDVMPAELKAMCGLFAGAGVEACKATTGVQSLQCRFVMQRMDEGMLHCEDGERARDCLTQLLILGLRDGVKACDALAATEGQNWKPSQKEQLVEQCRAIYTGKPETCPADPIGALSTQTRYQIGGALGGGTDGVKVWLAAVSNVPAACVVDVSVRRGGSVLLHRMTPVFVPAHVPSVVKTMQVPRDIDPVRDEVSVGHTCVPTVAWNTPGTSQAAAEAPR